MEQEYLKKERSANKKKQQLDTSLDVIANNNLQNQLGGSGEELKLPMPLDTEN